MNRYNTGLVAWPRESCQPTFPFNGAGWRAILASKRDKQMGNGREVVILAKSWMTAQNALDLIAASLSLFEGDPPLFGVESRLIAHNSKEPSIGGTDASNRGRLFEGMKISQANIPTACAIAARASKCRRMVYAITKYGFSINLHSQPVVELEPFKSSHLGVSARHKDHILLSHALVSSYSALEELGLELRASAKRPSRINREWNPEVWSDIQMRLGHAGIDIEENILWTVRGSQRILEKKRPIPPFKKAPWSKGPVRDCELHIIDAIAYADWMRDRVASHSVKDLTTVLTPYDVVNVQHLARRLILESLGYWRKS